MSDFLRKFHERHERIKNYVHTAWRMPLPPWGQKVMGFVYFCIPLVGGYYTWLYVNQRSIENIGVGGSKLREAAVANSSDHDDDNPRSQNYASPPAPSNMGGVKLVQSTKETQQQNNHMLQAFLKQQQKQMQRKQEDQ